MALPPRSSDGQVVVISGPSGVGKGAVHTRLRQLVPDSRLAISVTTRPARDFEQDGVDYRFVDRVTFDELVAQGALLEHAEYAGNWYGTPRDQVDHAIDEGVMLILDIDVQGAIQVKRALPGALLVFLLPPTMDELARRLHLRGTEDDVAIRRRLERARDEIAARHDFDVIVVNNDLDACVAEVLDALA
ncbi:MAG: guanylate kinase [Nitriliruptoraceae bacterium]